MEKKTHHYRAYTLFFAIVFALAILAFIFCILAEFRKSKIENVKLDGKFCELPGSEAFGFGIAALICSITAQVLGNLIIFVRLRSSCGETKASCVAKLSTVSSILLVVSWINFGISLILIGTATSMNRRQPYGKGWLGGECYIVKDGVYIGAAILVLVSLGCTLASATATLKMKFQVSIDNTKGQKYALPNEIK